MSRIMPSSLKISQHLAGYHHDILRLRIIGSSANAGNPKSIQAAGSGTTVAVPMRVPLLNSNKSPEPPMGTAKSNCDGVTEAFAVPASLMLN